MLFLLLLTWCSIVNSFPIDIQKLQPVYSLDQLQGIQKFIEFPDQYEQPFLKGFPDLPLNLLRQANATAPHCLAPFIGPNPWFKIKYPRMPYVAVLQDWYIDPSYPRTAGAIFNNKQKLLLRYNAYEVFEDIKKYENKKVIHVDKAVHLLQKCFEGYYHFLIEFVPRLLLVKNIIEEDSSIKILCMSPAKNFMFQAFDLLGIDTERIVFCDPKSLYHVDTLYFPKPAYMGYPSREELIRARNALLPAVKNYNNFETGEVVEEEQDLIIVIERLEVGRHVINTQQLVDTMKTTFPHVQNSIVIFDGRLSLVDQINLFKRAKIILGPHGAGFSNMLFASPGTVNIEFLPERFLTILYWHIAQALNQKHHYILIPNGMKNAPFIVPIDQVIEYLKKYIT